MFRLIRDCPVPVIGRVQGSAFGGGAGIVSACDVALSLSTAKFGFTEVKLGIIPAVISPIVMEKIGSAAASRYFLSGETFDAAEARRIGLVSQVFATEKELDDSVASLVSAVEKNGPEAVRAAKQLIKTVLQEKDQAALLEYTTNAIVKARSSPEGQEGLAAFLEKRAPKWA
jgi:methylglutaconyl-CoA hydratase